jgi:hypothetical protein
MTEGLEQKTQPNAVAWPLALLVALGIASFLGWHVYHDLAPGATGGDFSVYRNAARHLLAGRNPYDFDTLLYPLPVAIVVVPLAGLDPVFGAATFAGLGIIALVYGLLRRFGWPGLAMLASPAFFLGFYYLQWSPYIVAGALLPWLGAIGAAKPNVALATFAYRPNVPTIVGGVVMLVLAFVLVPTWVTDWLGDIGRQSAPHTASVGWPLGAVGLLGALRWRTPQGRVLLVATLSPLNPQIYDHLAFWLVARNWRESAFLSVCAWAGFLSFLATAPHDLTRDASPAQIAVSLGVNLPATIIVLRQRNRGNVPAWMEKVVGRLPRWLRGEPIVAIEPGSPDQTIASTGVI